MKDSYFKGLGYLVCLCFVTSTCADNNQQNAKKKHTERQKNPNLAFNTTSFDSLIITSRKKDNEVNEPQKSERKGYSISDIHIYTNEDFEEFISFTLLNNSEERKPLTSPMNDF